MKRGRWTAIVLALAMVAALGVWSLAGADTERRYEERGYGGYGGGRGEMWEGNEGYGMHWGPGARMESIWNKLSAEQREQVRAIQQQMRQQSVDHHAVMQKSMLTMGEAMGRFPLDRKAAQEAFAQMSAERMKMFAQRLDAMAKVQQVVGAELWEQMRGPGGEGMGPGMMSPGWGGGPGMGPGMMGPGWGGAPGGGPGWGGGGPGSGPGGPGMGPGMGPGGGPQR